MFDLPEAFLLTLTREQWVVLASCMSGEMPDSSTHPALVEMREEYLQQRSYGAGPAVAARRAGAAGYAEITVNR